MNDRDEHYELSDPGPLLMAPAAADRGCSLIVGGKWGAGGRACNHAREEHTGSRETGDLLCLGCEREGVPKNRYVTGIGQIWPGKDHEFTLPPRPSRRVEPDVEERAAA